MLSNSVLLDKIINELNTKQDKYKSIRDGVLDIRLIWEEFQRNVKENDNLSKAGVAALKLSATLIWFVHSLGHGKDEKLVRYVSRLKKVSKDRLKNKKKLLFEETYSFDD